MRCCTFAGLITLLMVPALIVGGCGDDDVPEEPLVLGEGEIPETLPAGFPIPTGASIGATMIDRSASTTEVDLEFGAGLPAVVSEFTVGLVGAGYVVFRSEDRGDRWVVEFGRGALSGRMVLVASGDATRATLSIVDP